MDFSMQSFLIALLISSATVSLVALLYMAGMPFLSKYFSERGRYYAWLIIIIGLIIPFRPEWDNALISVEVPSASQLNQSTIVQVQTNTTIPGNYQPSANLPAAEHAAASYATSLNPWHIVGITWLAGVAIFIAYHAIKHFMFLKMTKRWSVPVTDADTRALLQSRKSETGITRHISLYVCSCIDSPMLVGVLNPRILLPDIKQDELGFILQHELVHYKRKDLLIKYLVLAATALHWFNPVVHLVAKAVNNSCETSCDAEILQNADTKTRYAYTETIISVARQKTKLQTALATNLYGGKKTLKKRITSIMDTRKKRVGAMLTCLILASALIVGGLAVQAQSNGDLYDVDVDMDVDADVENINTEYDNTEQIQEELLEEHENNYEQLNTQAQPPRLVSEDVFGIYEEFGLIINQEYNRLEFDGEVVRYFEDAVQFDDGTGQTLRFFDANGTAFVHAVREGYDEFPLTAWDTPTLQGVARFTQEEIDTGHLDNWFSYELTSDPNIVTWNWEAVQPQRTVLYTDEVADFPPPPNTTEEADAAWIEEQRALSERNTVGGPMPPFDSIFATGPIAAGQGWFLPSTLTGPFEEATDIAWFEAWLEMYGEQIRADIINGIVTPAEHQTLFDCDSLYQIYDLRDEAVRDGTITAATGNNFWFIVLNEVHYTNSEAEALWSPDFLNYMIYRWENRPGDYPITIIIDDHLIDVQDIIEHKRTSAVITLYGINIMFQVTIEL